MKKLEEKDRELLEFLMSLNQKTTHLICRSELEKFYSDIIETDNYIIAMGNIPVVLLAHMDTVRETDGEYMMLYDSELNIATSVYGLGFDDKAGIAAIFKIIEDGYRPYVIFTHDEEKGGVGAYQLVKDYPEPPFKDKIKYMIQIDRRGKDDCVFYDDGNKEFHNYVESFGYYKTNYGSFSDISTIAPTWKVSAVNLSTGYYNEHTPDEFLIIDEWYQTIDEIKKMLDNIDTAPYFVYEDTFGYPYIDFGICDYCGKPLSYNNAVPVIGSDGEIKYYCDDCLDHYCDLCPECGNFYEIENPNITLCKNCWNRIIGDVSWKN